MTTIVSVSPFRCRMWAQHDRLDAHDPSHDIELARHLNKSLQVELRELSDREAIVWMDIENRHRAEKRFAPCESGEGR